MEVKIGRVTRNENEPVSQPQGPRQANMSRGGPGVGWVVLGAEWSVGAFLCDYMFNLLHISKKKERKNVRYDRANLRWSRCECQANERRLQWNRSPQPLMESQWTSEAGGSARADSPAIRVEDPLYLQQPPRLGLSVIIASLSRGWNAAWSERRESMGEEKVEEIGEVAST